MRDKRLSTAFQSEDRAVGSRAAEPCSLPLEPHRQTQAQRTPSVKPEGPKGCLGKRLKDLA